MRSAKSKTTIEKRRAGRGHRYEVAGKHLPGVTSIVRARGVSPALDWWKLKEVAFAALDARNDLDAMVALQGTTETVKWLANAPGRASETAAADGTTVHEKIVAGDRSDPRSDAAHRFLEENGLKVLAHECVGASTAKGYAGTIDAVAEDAEGNLVVVDWKADTSDDPDKKLAVWPEASLQVTAYQRFDTVPDVAQWPPRGAPRGCVVALGRDGSYMFGEIDAAGPVGRAAFDEFEASLEVWHQVHSPASRKKHYFDAVHAPRPPAAHPSMSSRKAPAPKVGAPTARGRQPAQPRPQRARSSNNGRGPRTAKSGLCGFPLRKPDGTLIKECANPVSDETQRCHLHG